MSVRDDHQASGLTTGLGWFSLALGAVQLASPDTVNRFIGVQPTEADNDLMRAIGVRELIAGFGILTRDEPSGFLWARAAGDVMDLGLLGTALTSDSERGRTGMAFAAVAGVAALDVLAATQWSQPAGSLAA